MICYHGNNFRRLITVIAICFLLSSLTIAQSAQKAKVKLNSAQTAIQEMEKEGMQTTRVNDLFFQANISYQAHLALNQSGKQTDFSQTIENCEKIIEIKNTAFNVYDEIEALENRIEGLEDKDLNLSKIKASFRSAKEEFRSERYEQAEEKVDETYKRISESQAISNRLQAIYDATRKNIAYFIRNNWQWFTLLLVVALVGGAIAKRRIEIYLLRKKKQRLLLRKETIKNLIEEAQYSYFEKGDISEETYSTRTDKFGEMLRDLNRRIPLVEEDLRKKTGFLERIKNKQAGKEEAD